MRNEEVSDRATVEIGRRARENRAQRARLRVAAGEAGVSGGSFEAAIRNSLARQARDEELIKLDARRGRRANTARYNSATSYIDGPNLALAGLQIASNVHQYKRTRLPRASITGADPLPSRGGPRVA